MITILFIIYFLFNKKNRVIKCNQQFALCPAAKCTPDPLNNNNAYCFCGVYKGYNYSYGNKTCSDISPYDGPNGEKFIYSTFSPKIASLGFEQIQCPNPKGVNLDCMNKKCSINPHDPRHAVCNCSKINNEGNPWNTWNKINTVSSCNYLSGASIELKKEMFKFIKSQN